MRNLKGLRLTRQVTRLLASIRGEQTSSNPQLYQLLAKGTNMSEEKLSYMASLDEWTKRVVINPVADAWVNGSDEETNLVEADVKKAIREKALESYRNGQNAGPQKLFKRR